MIRILRYTSLMGMKEWLVVAHQNREKQPVRAMPLAHFIRHPVRSLGYLLDNGTERLLGPPDFTWKEVWAFVLAVDLAVLLMVLFVHWVIGS